MEEIYSEDEFYFEDELREHQNDVWRVRRVTAQRLAKLLSQKLNKYLKKGYTLDKIYKKLRNHEIQVKCSPEIVTVADGLLCAARADAITAKYAFKMDSYFHAGIRDPLRNYFYRILKERHYTQNDINTISAQLGIDLTFDDYNDWRGLYV